MKKKIEKQVCGELYFDNYKLINSDELLDRLNILIINGTEYFEIKSDICDGDVIITGICIQEETDEEYEARLEEEELKSKTQLIVQKDKDLALYEEIKKKYNL